MDENQRLLILAVPTVLELFGDPMNYLGTIGLQRRRETEVNQKYTYMVVCLDVKTCM